MSYNSPRGGGGSPYYTSTTSTPSPGPAHSGFPPPRSATRNHHRSSSSAAYGTPNPHVRSATAVPQQMSSPRYKSNGEYGTLSGSGFYPPPTPRPAAFQQFAETRYSATPQPPSSSRRSSTKTSSHTHSRRSSTSAPQHEPFQRPATSASKHRKSTSTSQASSRPAPVATEEDRKKHKIPKGYSMKNWDPTEAPILLLGSVFDANSLGRWIYDWTASVHGPATPISDMAGELWLLLIQLYGKVARMDKVINRVRDESKRELLRDFLESGDRLVGTLQDLLKACEKPMLLAGDGGSEKALGSASGVQFVEYMFGRDKKLPAIEKYMQQIRVFNHRFDANCESIVRNPTK